MSEKYLMAITTVFDIQNHFATVTEKVISAYIAQQEEASSENVIKVSDE